jgi:hypothetical protein
MGSMGVGVLTPTPLTEKRSSLASVVELPRPWDSGLPKGTAVSDGTKLRRGPVGVGLVDEFFPQDRDVGRGLDAEADDTRLDGHHPDGDAEAGQDDALVEAARKDEHGQTPFRMLRGTRGERDSHSPLSGSSRDASCWAEV